MFVSLALIAPVIVTASVPPVIVKACVTVVAFAPILAAFSVIKSIVSTLKLSTFTFKSTISEASALKSFVVNVISSLAFTFVIAANVVSTAPVVIVAVKVPLIAVATSSTSLASTVVSVKVTFPVFAN